MRDETMTNDEESEDKKELASCDFLTIGGTTADAVIGAGRIRTDKSGLQMTVSQIVPHNHKPPTPRVTVPDLLTNFLDAPTPWVISRVLNGVPFFDLNSIQLRQMLPQESDGYSEACFTNGHDPGLIRPASRDRWISLLPGKLSGFLSNECCSL